HQEAPVVVAGRVPASMPPPRQVHELPVGVELALARGVVARPRRRRAAIALQRLQYLATDPPLAARPVEHLQILRMPGGRAHDERAECIGFLDGPELGERPGAEARVADPRVAVVPVA